VQHLDVAWAGCHTGQPEVPFSFSVVVGAVHFRGF
jgi:hypothetical protein